MGAWDLLENKMNEVHFSDGEWMVIEAAIHGIAMGRYMVSENASAWDVIDENIFGDDYWKRSPTSSGEKGKAAVDQLVLSPQEADAINQVTGMSGGKLAARKALMNSQMIQDVHRAIASQGNPAYNMLLRKLAQLGQNFGLKLQQPALATAPGKFAAQPQQARQQNVAAQDQKMMQGSGQLSQAKTNVRDDLGDGGFDPRSELGGGETDDVVDIRDILAQESHDVDEESY
jgi:hypothetical protein